MMPTDGNRFDPTNDTYGSRLALVFGNQATDGQCPFYRGGFCSHCDIGAGEGHQATDHDNLHRLRWFTQAYREYWASLRHLLVYNSGSVLNPAEFSLRSLQRVLRFANRLPQLLVVSLESREQFITVQHLARIASLHPSLTLNVILGLEDIQVITALDVLNKRMTIHGIHTACAAIRAACLEFSRIIELTFNVMIGAPTNSGPCGPEAAVTTCRFCWDLGDHYGIRTSINIHPYYISKRSSRAFGPHQHCSTGLLLQSVVEIMEIKPRHAGPVFIGINDEQHSEMDISNLREFADVISKFNVDQDSTVFLPVIGELK